MGSVREWKEKIDEMNNRDWMEEIEGKRSLSLMVQDGEGRGWSRTVHKINCAEGEPEAAFQTEDWLSGVYGRQEEV